MYLFDTDTLLHLWGNQPNVVDRLRRSEDSEIGTTVVTKCEILRPRCDHLLKANSPAELLRAQERFERTERCLAELLIVPFDELAAAQFQRLTAVSRLRRIGRADLLIASIALANRAALVTRNVKDFHQVPDLRVENWVD